MIAFQGASGPEMLSLWQAFRGGVFQTDGETRHIMYMDGFFLIQDNIFRHPIRICLSFVLPNQLTFYFFCFQWIRTSFLDQLIF